MIKGRGMIRMKEHQVVSVKSPKGMAFVLMLGAFVGLFSETALNMALTNIMQDFSVSAATAQWLTTGYLLTLGILVPVSALLIRWFTTKQLVIVSFILSIAGSVIAALSTTFTLLLLGRIVQALGTGIILPLMMNVILLIFPIYKRGMVMGLMGLVMTTAPAVGPTIAGILVDILDWSYIFWLNLALYAVILIFGFKKIENVSTITKPKIDVLSIILSTIGFGGIIYSLSSIAEKSITTPSVYLSLLAGVVAISLFVARQLTMKVPMINLQVFKYTMFTLAIIQIFIAMLLILSTAILLPMYLKGSLLLTAALAGLTLLPGSAINAALAPMVGKYFDRIGAKKLLAIGFTLTLIGAILFVLILSDDVPIWAIILTNMVFFAGIAFIMMPAQTNGLNQLPRKLYSDGSAVMNTLQQIAGAAGTAIAITLMIHGEKMYREDNPAATMSEALASGTNYAYYFIAAIALIGLVSTAFVKKAELPKE